MKKIKCEIQKIFYFPLSCLSCIGITGVCLLSECYMDETGKAYTVIEMIINRENVNMLDSVYLNSLEIWKRGLGTWSYLLLPLLLSLGYLFTLSKERQSGAIRPILIREGNFKYCLSKIVSAVICSGTLIVIGYALYGLIVWLCFPSLHAYPDSEVSFYMEYYLPDGIMPFVIKRMIGIALYGIYMNSYAIGISLVFVDPYILLCLPMMLSYTYSQVITKLSMDAFSRNKMVLAERVEFLRMENVIGIEWNVSWFCGMIFMIVTYILLFALFYFFLKKTG